MDNQNIAENMYKKHKKDAIYPCTTFAEYVREYKEDIFYEITKAQADMAMPGVQTKN